MTRALRSCYADFPKTSQYRWVCHKGEYLPCANFAITTEGDNRGNKEITVYQRRVDRYLSPWLNMSALEVTTFEIFHVDA